MQNCNNYSCTLTNFVRIYLLITQKYPLEKIETISTLKNIVEK